MNGPRFCRRRALHLVPLLRSPLHATRRSRIGFRVRFLPISLFGCSCSNRDLYAAGSTSSCVLRSSCAYSAFVRHAQTILLTISNCSGVEDDPVQQKPASAFAQGRAFLTSHHSATSFDSDSVESTSPLPWRSGSTEILRQGHARPLNGPKNSFDSARLSVSRLTSSSHSMERLPSVPYTPKSRGSRKEWSCTDGIETRASIEQDGALWRRRKAQRGENDIIRDPALDADMRKSAHVPSVDASVTPDSSGNPDRPFPFTNARYIPQVDMTEDGLPPVPRAVAAQRHLEVMIEVKEVIHLPAQVEEVDDIDETSFYCVQMAINNESFQTDARRGSVKTGCKWYDRFNVHLPESMLRSARQAVLKGDVGPAFIFSLYDSGKYSAKSAIGQAIVPVKDILDVVEDGLSVSLRLQKESRDGGDNATAIPAQDVIGADGGLTCVNLQFYTLLANLQEEWFPPTLQETLAACDEKRIVLNPARKLLLNESTKSGISPELSIFNLSRNDAKEDSLGSPSEFHVDEGFQDDFVFPSYKGIDYHWRERLEEIMDSLAVNLLVVLFVVIDLTNLIVFTIIYPTSEDDDEPIAALSLSIVVVSCLCIELTLRQIALGRRFWKSWVNIFDAVVVYLSASICVVRVVVPVAAIKQLQGFVVLRAMRSVAVALRVVRVLINLRRARKLSGHVAKKLRTTVSQNKRRYKKHGFDLDLTYITNRVIAMGTPAFGQHSSYRNDIHVVSRFMAFRHYGCFFIFNLCDTYTSSDGMTGNYNPGMLFNQVQRIPFEDHGPPLMSELLQFCEEAQLWMLKDSRNVVAVHCKGGKGRSGVMTSALILWSGHRKSALDALELFTFRRTRNYDAALGIDGNYQDQALNWKELTTGRKANQTVEGPSQIRYVHYLEAVLYSGIDPLEMNKVLLNRITLPVGELQAHRPMYISVMVRCLRYPIFDSCNTSHDRVWVLGGNVGDTVALPMEVIVWGDVRVEIYRHTTEQKSSPRKLFAFCVFNTAFYKDRDHITFAKPKIDILNKDRGHLIVHEDFWLTLQMEPGADHELLRLEAKTRQIFYKYGTRSTISPGDWLIRGSGFLEDNLYLIASGSVEGVVHGMMQTDGTGPLGQHMLFCYFVLPCLAASCLLW